MTKKVIVLIALGIFVFWAGSAYGAGTIRLIVNGNEIKSDPPAQIVNGRTMAPIRFVAEALGAKVNWDANNRNVQVDMPLINVNNNIWTDQYSYDDYVSPDVTVLEYIAAIRGRNPDRAKLLSTPNDPDYTAKYNVSDFSLTGTEIPSQYTMGSSQVTHFEFIDGRNAPSELLVEKDQANGGWQIRVKVYYERRANPADYYSQIVDFLVIRRPPGWHIDETPFVIRHIMDVGNPIKINDVVGPFIGYVAPY